MSEFRERLQELIDKEGINQRQLSEKIGVTKVAVTEWMYARAIPTPAHEKKIALSFPHVNVYWLWGFDGEPYFRTIFKKLESKPEEQFIMENKLLKARITDMEYIIQIQKEEIERLKSTK